MTRCRIGNDGRDGHHPPGVFGRGRRRLLPRHSAGRRPPADTAEADELGRLKQFEAELQALLADCDRRRLAAYRRGNAGEWALCLGRRIAILQDAAFMRTLLSY